MHPKLIDVFRKIYVIQEPLGLFWAPGLQVNHFNFLILSCLHPVPMWGGIGCLTIAVSIYLNDGDLLKHCYQNKIKIHQNEITIHYQSNSKGKNSLKLN